MKKYGPEKEKKKKIEAFKTGPKAKESSPPPKKNVHNYSKIKIHNYYKYCNVHPYTEIKISLSTFNK